MLDNIVTKFFEAYPELKTWQIDTEQLKSHVQAANDLFNSKDVSNMIPVEDLQYRIESAHAFEREEEAAAYAADKASLNPTEPSPRVLAQAVQCQLLTGSYDGATRSCPCKSPAECKLTWGVREQLRLHPQVLAARDQNLFEYTQGLVRHRQSEVENQFQYPDPAKHGSEDALICQHQ